MKKPVPVELLAKYIDGDCTQAEIALVKQWYASFEHDLDGTSGLSFSEEKALEERMYQNILENIGTSRIPAQPNTTITRNFSLWYKLAGVAALIFIAGAAIVLNMRKAGKLNPANNAAVSDVVVITNNSGQIYKANLPDNSSVWLNPHAQLTFPKVFAAQARKVSMKGECFFEISKNPKRPFIISSNSIVTKVWGTSFLVRDNEFGKSADVSVLTGKVSVSIKSNQDVSASVEKGEVMLYPHQKVVYLADKHVLQPLLAAKAEPALQIWTRVNLSFENQPLSEIIPVLNAKFHVHIKASSAKVNHYMLTADLSGFNLADVLEALKKSLNVSYQIKSDSIELV